MLGPEKSNNACSRCLRFPLRAMNRFSLAVRSIMTSTFAALQLIYEKVVYNSAQRKARELGRHYVQHEEKVKKAFFQLGILKIDVDFNKTNDLCEKINAKNTNCSLFEKYEDKKNILKACEPHLEALKEEYTAGKNAFQKIQDAVTRIAKKSSPETAPVNTKKLTAALIYEGFLTSNTSDKLDLSQILPVIVQTHFDAFNALFQDKEPVS